MGTIKNILNSLAVRNAVQQQNDGFKSTLYSNNIDPFELFRKDINKVGEYDNYYGDANKIVTGAVKYPFYYKIDNEVVDPSENKIAYYLKNPNSSYPQGKVFEQIYTELITHGHCDIFFWRKNGVSESRVFTNKKYNEDDFRGITLVSGEDKTKFSKADKDNIVRITYGASQKNVFMGYSPTQAARSWRKMQDEMGLHMTAFAKNSGMPIGTFVISAENIDEYVKIKESLDGKVNGAKNNGKVLYSYMPSTSKQSQITWVSYTSQNVQDYTNQLEFAEKKMTQSFGVPGTIKGTNDSENYATANVSKRNFVEWTISPLVETVREQLEFYLSQRFELTGEISVDIELPELADESLVKIQTTTQQVALFDQKISEGYSAESIVRAYALPERFLLLEKTSNSSSSSNTPTNEHKHVCNCHKCQNKAKNDLELVRRYQNEFTEEERADIEAKFTAIAKEYANYVLENGIDDESREEFEGKMSAEFSSQYQKLFDRSLDDVAESLVEILGTVDVASLKLTEEELTEAVSQYNDRVSSFSKSFAEQVDALEGETLEVRTTKSEPYVKRVVVTESEHSRIVSEMKAWSKAPEEFPVKVFKTWHTQGDSRVCPDCAELNGTSVDVTALFVNDPNIDEIYEIQGGGYHPNCRCFVTYEMEKRDDNN